VRVIRRTILIVRKSTLVVESVWTCVRRCEFEYSAVFCLLVAVENHILASAVCSIFPKSVSNLVILPVVNIESDPNRNVGRTDLSGELGSVPAPRETDPTPAVTRPGAGPASVMVTG